MRWFVTATDTGAGKTFFCRRFVAALRRSFTPDRVLGMKPLVCGGDEDVRELLSEQPERCAEDSVFASFRMPAAPSVAAEEEGASAVSPSELLSWCRQGAARHEHIVLEGVGGWMVPVSRRWCVADWAQSLGWPVLLVVANRLGCLNHTLLTVADLHQRKIPFAGIVLNHLPDADPSSAFNRRVLERDFELPVLGEIAPGAENLDATLLERIFETTRAISPPASLLKPSETF